MFIIDSVNDDRMEDVGLATVDLNLSTALEAPLEERSVTRAAARVGLSRPATSHVLGRLRTLFGDRLLLRDPTGTRPTSREESLREPRARSRTEHGV